MTKYEIPKKTFWDVFWRTAVRSKKGMKKTIQDKKKVLYMGSSMLLAGLSCAVWISDIQENRQESVQKTYTDIVYNAVKICRNINNNFL